MIRHYFHFDEGISVGFADFLDYLFNNILDQDFDYLVPKFRAEHDMIVDIVDTVVCSSIHIPIISNVQLFANILIASRKAAPFILPHKGVGFQGQRSIKKRVCVDQRQLHLKRGISSVGTSSTSIGG